MRSSLEILIITTSLFLACNSKIEERQEGAESVSGSASTASATEAALGNDSYYTGFDGSTDYSILLPKLRNVTIKDPSVAKVEEVKVTLSASIIEALVAEAKAKNSAFDETKFRQMLGREQTTYRVTPLKAGQTTLLTSGGRGGAPGKSQKGFNKSAQINLIISPYTFAQWELGKTRYENDGVGGQQRSCRSCHEKAASGAPPHELGRIMEISDQEAIAWITTGEGAGRVASVPRVLSATIRDLIA